MPVTPKKEEEKGPHLVFVEEVRKILKIRKNTPEIWREKKIKLGKIHENSEKYL